MLQDSDVNVYQQSKVVLKEEAFYIRGKKQKTAAQKEQIIRERRNQAKRQLDQIKQQQIKQFQNDNDGVNIPIFANKDQELFRGDDYGYDNYYRPDYKRPDEIVPLNLNLKGMKGVKDFTKYEQATKNRK